ncbi:hypothetical protein [Tunturiibacter lichenicola]|uniref:hypothetical protein n=1 Tax=Tunturiibacter lichenicola TaxID=2051959 RepID=UPI003D9AD17D
MTNRFPAPSTATPTGSPKPPTVRMVGLLIGMLPPHRDDLRHHTVALIREEDISCFVHSHAIGAHKVVAAHVVDRRAGGYDAGGVPAGAGDDLRHQTGVPIRDEDIPGAVHRHSNWKENPLPTVLTVELEDTTPGALPPLPATISFTALLSPSATKTFPALSTATPWGELTVDQAVVAPRRRRSAPEGRALRFQPRPERHTG